MILIRRGSFVWRPWILSGRWTRRFRPDGAFCTWSTSSWWAQRGRRLQTRSGLFLWLRLFRNNIHIADRSGNCLCIISPDTSRRTEPWGAITRFIVGRFFCTHADSQKPLQIGFTIDNGRSGVWPWSWRRNRCSCRSWFKTLFRTWIRSIGTCFGS